MDNPVLAAPVVAILGLIVPFLVSVLKASKAPAWANQVVALAVCIAAGAASVVIDAGPGGMTLAALLGHAGAIFAIAQTAYRVWFVATPLNARLEAAVFGSPAAGPAVAVVLAGLVSVLALGP